MISIQENMPLAPYTSLKIGGKARFFTEARTEDEIMQVVQWARKQAIPLTVLGAGSNVLVSDKGVDGLVVRLLLTDVVINNCRMYACARTQMAQGASLALKNNCAGMEWAVGIPGTIGGSIYGNAGCFGGEMKDIAEHVRVLMCERNEIVEIPAADCEFGYRESIFKKRKDWIILGATLKLYSVSEEEKKEKQAWVSGMMQERIHEQAIGEKTMGSTFKGIPITNERIQLLFSYDSAFHKKEHTCWVFENRAGYLSSGFLIERAGLKGKRVGGIMVSRRHANFLINKGNATSDHVVILIGIIKEYVHRKFGVMLEEEIQYVGF